MLAVTVHPKFEPDDIMHSVSLPVFSSIVRRVAGLFFVIFVINFVANVAFGQPFVGEYRLALGSIALDGDLVETIPIGEVYLKNGYKIDVFLEHRTERNDYRKGHSVFKLVPFETCFYKEAKEKYVWLRPGGGEFHIGRDDSVEKEDLGDEIKDLQEDLGSRNATVLFRRGTTTIATDAEGDAAEIMEGGWVLFYRDGKLSKFKTPDGEFFHVDANGRMITGISNGGEIVASVVWNEEAAPLRLQIGRNTAEWKYFGEKLVAVAQDGEKKGKIEFLYSNEMIARILDEGSMVCDTRWALAKHSAPRVPDYQTQLFAQTVNNCSYNYVDSGDMIAITEGCAGSVRKLRVIKRYGAIIRIEQ